MQRRTMRVLQPVYSFWSKIRTLALQRGIRRIHLILLFLIVLTCVSFLVYHNLPSPDNPLDWIQHFKNKHWKTCSASSFSAANTSLQDPRWQRVIDGVYVYSAFITDKRPPNRTVEIIAVVKNRDSQFLEDVSCGCVFSDGKGGMVDSEIRVSNERHANPKEIVLYGDVRFICDIPDTAATNAVGIKCHSRSACETLTLPLHPLPDQSPRKLSFALCGPVLYGETRADRLVEFIEYYQLIGVDKFVFYVYEISQEIQRVLEHYRGQGKLDILIWSIPGLNIAKWPTDIWYFAQTAALNDCTERMAYLWDYTIITDVDEFLAISSSAGLPSLVNHGHDDCVTIRATNMQLAPPTPQSPSTSLLVRSSLHQSYIYPSHHRTKTISRGRHVLAAGPHYPLLLQPGIKCRFADPYDEALVFHMREQLLPDVEEEWTWVEDRRVLVYADEVERRVKHVMRQLE